jgi:hypothetical protein
MRLIQLFVLLLVLASCGNGKIRYVRVKGQPQQVIAEAKEETPAAEVSTSSIIQEHAIFRAEEQSMEEDQIIEYKAEDSFVSLIESVEDEPEPNKKEKIVAAFNAEQKAIKARRNLRLSVIFLGTSMIPLGFTSLLFIPALVLFIIGAVHYGKANRSRFITAEGQEVLNRSRGFIVAWIVWAVLVMLLIGAFFLIFW